MCITHKLEEKRMIHDKTFTCLVLPCPRTAHSYPHTSSEKAAVLWLSFTA